MANRTTAKRSHEYPPAPPPPPATDSAGSPTVPQVETLEAELRCLEGLAPHSSRRATRAAAPAHLDQRGRNSRSNNSDNLRPSLRRRSYSPCRRSDSGGGGVSGRERSAVDPRSSWPRQRASSVEGLISALDGRGVRHGRRRLRGRAAGDANRPSHGRRVDFGVRERCAAAGEVEAVAHEASLEVCEMG